MKNNMSLLNRNRCKSKSHRIMEIKSRKKRRSKILGEHGMRLVTSQTRTSSMKMMLRMTGSETLRTSQLLRTKN